MVFFNYATMQMAAKIVYYGPGLCGKTTNLHHIYSKTSPQSRGEMVSLETETDRTLFFDLLPIDVGVIGGFKTRLQLYTVPGQVFYNTTRKLVLKGVDGIVFVVDSQLAMLEANADSFKNLRENLAEIGLNIEEIPLVFQLNKRDLPNIGDPDTVLTPLDPERRFEYVEAIANSGVGVFETLKLISKLTLRTLRRRMTGEEPVKPAAKKLADVATFRVKDEPSAPAPRATAQPFAAASPAFTAPAPTLASPSAAPVAEPEESSVEVNAPDEVVEEVTTSDDADDIAAAPPEAPATETEPEEPPSTQYIPPPDVAATASEAASDASDSEEPAVAADATHAAEPEVDFSRSEPARATPDVKHVKVRSSVDIMAELEALRKRATQPAAPKQKKETRSAELAAVAEPAAKTDVRRSVSLRLPPGVAGRTRNVRVTVSFENDDEVLHKDEQVVDFAEGPDARSLSVDLKITID